MIFLNRILQYERGGFPTLLRNCENEEQQIVIFARSTFKNRILFEVSMWLFLVIDTIPRIVCKLKLRCVSISEHFVHIIVENFHFSKVDENYLYFKTDNAIQCQRLSCTFSYFPFLSFLCGWLFKLTSFSLQLSAGNQIPFFKFSQF